MTSSPLIGALLLTLLVTAAAAFATRWLGAWTRRAVEAVHLAGITIALLFTLAVVAAVLQHQTLSALGGWLLVDALGAIFVGLVIVVGFLAGVYSIGYMRHDLAKGDVGATGLSTYYGFFDLFLCTMILAVTSNNLVMMWVAIEATTLSSVFLVGFYGRRTSLEAAWKYVVICTVGVAFGLYGTVLVFSNANAVLASAEDAILWTEVVKHATALDPGTISIAFVFVLIGFGTKVGLFPMQGWLPDAYTEAPSPASALLSAALESCALLVIIRHTAIAVKAVGPQFPQILFLIFGVLSIGAADFIVLGLGLGGPLGVAAALLHTMNHGLAKTLMFCGSGNILMKYRTCDLSAVKGMLRVAPISGLLLMAGALALGSTPPFNVFVSEFLTVAAGVKAGYAWLMVVYLLLLTIVLTAFSRMITGSILGPAPGNVARSDLSALTLVPMGVLLALMLLMGLHVPGPVTQLIADASETVLGTPAASAQLALSKPWILVDGTEPTGNIEAQLPYGAEERVPSCASVRTEKDTTCLK